LAYIFMMLAPDDLAFETLDDGTDDPVVTVRIATPAGTLLVMTEVAESGRDLHCRGCTFDRPVGQAPSGSQRYA
jgi:hypothetical protein